MTHRSRRNTARNMYVSTCMLGLPFVFACKAQPPADSNAGTPDSTQGPASSNAEYSSDAQSSLTRDAQPGSSLIQITTNTVDPSELAPIPDGFQLLYVTGAGVAATVDSLHVDGDTLYWGGGGLIWRASKDGSGTPVTFAEWNNTTATWMLSDDQYLYWFDKVGLFRKRKDSTRLSPSEAMRPFSST